MDVPESLTMRGRYTSALADGINARVATAARERTRMSGAAEEEEEGLRALTRKEAPIVIASLVDLLLFGISRIVVAPPYHKNQQTRVLSASGVLKCER